jgi:hypothetical protein
MRKVLFYPICLVLFIGAMWGIKTFLISLTPDFRNGFVLGMVLMVALVFMAEKLGFKEPTY